MVCCEAVSGVPGKHRPAKFSMMKRQNSTKPFQITKHLFSREQLQNDKQKATDSKCTKIMGNSLFVSFLRHAAPQDPRNRPALSLAWFIFCAPGELSSPSSEAWAATGQSTGQFHTIGAAKHQQLPVRCMDLCAPRSITERRL